MELQRRLGMTFIIVTHDQEEAMTMADRIGVMDAGRLEQVATPRELYEAPRSRWVAEFVGDINLFEGQSRRARSGRLTVATRDAGTIMSPSRARRDRDRRQRRGPAGEGQAVAACAGVRCGPSHAINRLEGVVTDVSYLGGSPPTRSGSTPAPWCARRWPIPRGSTSMPIPRPAGGGLVHARRSAWCWSNERAPYLRRPARYRRDRALSVDGAVLPGAVGFVLKISLSQTAIAQPPYTPVFDLTRVSAMKAAGAALARQFQAAGSDNLYILSYLRSLVVAAISTAILLLIGYPIAYGMARLPQRWQGIAMMLVIVPFWTSFLSASMPGSTFCSMTGLLNKILLALHLVSAPVVWLSTDTAMYLGIVYSYLPFMILPLYATLAKMDPALLEAASDLGASPGSRSGW